MQRTWVVALLVAALGCPVGTHAGSFEPAKSGAGIGVVVETESGRGPGVELLAVEDTALLVLADGRLTLAPYRVIRRVRVHQRSHLDFRRRGPSPRQREELRLLSRYPQGISAELLERLLAAYGQTELVVIER